MGSMVSFTSPCVAEVVPDEERPLGPGDVRLRTLFSGISAGTELTAYRGSNPYLTKRWDEELRLFVDGMMQVAEPSAQEREAIEKRIAAPGPIEAALEATSALLSDISGAAGMVMVPRREPRLTQLTLVPLSATRALAVLVGEDGGVENRVIELAARTFAVRGWIDGRGEGSPDHVTASSLKKWPRVATLRLRHT